MSQVKADELVKYLKNNGFKEARSLKGGRCTTIAFSSRKTIIPQGTYKAILKQTNLKDFKK